MKLYHLSHIDLDGYSAQYITRHYFAHAEYFNANYGPEVMAMCDLIIASIAKTKEESFVLITDLNLSIKEGDELVAKIEQLRAQGITIKLQLLDHHKTGADVAQKYDWYYLDNNRSATKITYDYMVEHYGAKLSSDATRFIEAVNATDIWLENEPLFEYGKVGMKLISDSKEINRYMFKDESFEYFMFLIDKGVAYINHENANIALDDAIHFLKKEYMMRHFANDTIENLKSYFLTLLLEQIKDSITIEYQGHKGVLSYSLGNISIIANRFLHQNSDIDFFMDIGPKGKISLRAANKIDVSEMSKQLFNGGGHANASGGLFKDFNESFDYAKVKSQVETLIASKEAN